MSEAQELVSVKKHILAALKAGDWQQFRQYCCPNIAIEEYWQIYQQYLSKDFAKQYRSPTSLRYADSAIVDGIKIATNRRLTKDEAIIFARFYNHVKDTLSAGIDDWIRVQREEEGAEYRALCGTAITGKVASNLHWWIQLERYQGEWKVRRLVIEGH